MFAWSGSRLQRPATSRLRSKWIAKGPANTPGWTVGVSWNAPQPDRFVDVVAEAIDIGMCRWPKSRNESERQNRRRKNSDLAHYFFRNNHM